MGVMSESLNVALRISAVGAFDGVLNRLQGRIRGLGDGARQVQSDYDKMFRHLAKGFAGIAVAKYSFDRFLKPGIKDAADLQSSFNQIEQVLHGSHVNAAKLNRQMTLVKQNSIEVASHMMYSASAVAAVTSQLLQSGVPLSAIVEGRGKNGKIIRHGAAYESEILAEVSGMDPAQIAMRVGKIGHAFALDPAKYGQLVDRISRVKMSSSGTLDELMYNLEKAGPAFRQLRISPRQAAITMGALSPLGEQSASEVRAMLRGFQGDTPQQRKVLRALDLHFFNRKTGQFVGMPAAIKEMRRAFLPLSPELQQQYMYQLFRRGGTLAAEMLIAPDTKGAKTYSQISKESDAATSLAQRNAIKNLTYDMKRKELSSTMQTTAGILYQPVLSPLTKITSKLNDLTGKLGISAIGNHDIGKAFTYGTAGVVGLAGLYGVSHLLGAALPGGRVLRGIFGKFGRTAGGIAEGKAIQAVAGVPSVFVVNMPGGGISGVFGKGKGSALDAALAGQAIGTTRGLRGLLGSTVKLRGEFGILKGGIGAVTARLGLLGASIAVGAGIGHEIWKHRDRKKVAAEYAMVDWVREHVGGLWGDSLAAAHKRSEQIAREGLRRQAQRREALRHKVDIFLNVDSKGQVKVRKIETSHPDVNAHVGTALSMP